LPGGRKKLSDTSRYKAVQKPNPMALQAACLIPIQLSKNPALRFAQKSQIANQKFPGCPPAHQNQRPHTPPITDICQIPKGKK
jgi:hypothetical protein